MSVTAHRIVAKVAEELAATVYEEIAKDNANYKVIGSRRAFVRHAAPQLREEARRILAAMLERNDVSEAEKSEIYDALLADKALPRGGTSVAQ